MPDLNMIEIERKFLVTSEAFKTQASKKVHIIQGFLSTNKNRTVRVRLVNDKGFLTIKGKSSNDGLSRFEWEKQLHKQEAEALIKLCKKGIIYKTRYEIPVLMHTFEVDVFHAENEGLVVAEIELQQVNDTFKKPIWLGKEVTGNPKYYNSYLSKKPYTKWK